jgi:8-oxo-dGTP diphosphatase
VPSDGRHSVAVAAIVLDEQESVLLMKRRDHGNWDPPGGVMKIGESPPDAARREALEETGADTQVGPVTGVYTYIEEDVVTLAFRGEPGSKDITTSDEAASVRWVPLHEAPELLGEEHGLWIADVRSGGLENVRTQRQTVKGTSESPRN